MPTPNDQSRKSRDSRLESFLQKATPIITAERGLTEVARVKLQSLASDMRLPDELLSKGLDILQSEQPSITKKLNRYERAFKRSMHEKISKIKRGILTANMEARAVRVGTAKYQLTELQAREILRDLLKELGVQRVSVNQAERHVENMIEDLVGDNVFADKSTRERLIEQGHEWGLSAEHVEQMIVGHTEFNQQQRRREGTLMKSIIGVGVAVLLGLGGYFGYTHFNKPVIDVDSEGTGIVASDEGSVPKMPSASFWSDDVKLAAVSAQLAIRDLEPHLKQMANDDAASRQLAYESFSEKLDQLANDSTKRQKLKALLMPLLASEPDASAAQAMLRALGLWTSIREESLPLSELHTARSKWIVEMLTGVMRSKEASEERKQLVADQLFAMTGYSGADDSPEKLKRNYDGALLATQLRRLASLVGTKPADAIPSFAKLMKRASSVNNATKLEIATEFISSGIDVSSVRSSQFNEVMKWCVRDATPAEFPRLISAYENTSNQSAQNKLGDLLIDAINIGIDSTEPKEIATKMRSKLGIVESSILSIKTQRRKLTEQVKGYLDSVDLDTTDINENVSQTANIVYLSTLATFLFEGAGDSSEFRRLNELGLPDSVELSYLKELAPGAIKPAASTDETAEDTDDETTKPMIDESQMVNILRPLLRYRAFKIDRRVRALGAAALVAKQIPDVPQETAYGLAAYVFSTKNKTEHNEILTKLSSFTHWPTFVMALGDALESSDVSYDWQEQIAGAALDRIPKVSDPKQWTEAVRTELHRKAITIYAKSTISEVSPTSEKLDRFEKFMGVLAEKRMQQFGVSTRKSGSDESYFGATKSLYVELRQRSGTPSIQINRETAMIPVLSSNSIQQSVMISGMVAQELARIRLKDSPTKQPVLEAIVNNSIEINDRSRTALQQLMVNEYTILKLIIAQDE